jgi:oxaloacetate decarboxylase gamma subunit
MEQTLLNQGITLMLVGMGTVFVFLTALVIAMTLMAAIVRRLQPDVAVAGISNAEIAAIAAAIRQHRRTQADK